MPDSTQESKPKPKSKRRRRSTKRSSQTKSDSDAQPDKPAQSSAAKGTDSEATSVSTDSSGADGTGSLTETTGVAQSESGSSDASASGDGVRPEPRKRRRRGGRGRGRSRQDRKEETFAAERNGESKSAGRQEEEASAEKKGEPEASDQPGETGRGKSPESSSGRSRRKRKRKSSAPQSQTSKSTGSTKSPPSTDERVMIINVADGEERRIAVMHQGRLEEMFMERTSSESHVGNIYKGRVTNVEPSIQAAFVDFGLPKNGFLHISDLQPQYFPEGAGRTENVGRKTPRRDRPPIQKCLRRGQEVIVQVIKEGIGTKGPTLTTYISIPGRYLVMMPGMNRLGVSRRIDDEDARRKMRKVLDELELPKNMGFILRTAGMEKTKRELQRDLMYLQRLWKVVANRIKNERAPCELYQESDLVIRTIRDVYTSDFARIVIDEEQTAQKVRDFLALAMPRTQIPLEVYQDHVPLFTAYGIEEEIERINDRYVPLPSGASLVIDSTEACVTIDVNSGRSRDIEDAEESAYRVNLEAAEEIARQLRLRDLGGLIICDFIDMRLDKHRREVERALRNALKKHKERAKCLRTSQFGIIEMTRQRMRPSIKRSIYHDCPHCRGSGLVKNPESMSLALMRLLRQASHHDKVESINVRVAPEVASQLQNNKRASIFKLESDTGRRIFIHADARVPLDQYQIECYDRRGVTVRLVDTPTTLSSLPPVRSQRMAPPVEPEPPLDGDMAETVFD